MSAWLWALLLIPAILASHWGAERIALPLKKLRDQFGLSASAGAAIIGIATASPEIGINISSAARNVSNIGLGAMLGSNIIALPMIVMVTYLATRKYLTGNSGSKNLSLTEKAIEISPQAASVQAIPYIFIILLMTALIIPKPWRGIQPVDGWIMLSAYIIYLTQALFRKRKEKKQVTWEKREIQLALVGVLTLSLGAYFTVWSTENLVKAADISEIIGGLFITAPMAALPEIFAAWSIAKNGQISTSITGVFGDNAITLTLALLPLALVGLQIADLQLIVINIVFLLLLPVLYTAFIYFKKSWEGHGFKRWQVFSLTGVYFIYILTIILFEIF